jgi:hypothetical protein
MNRRGWLGGVLASAVLDGRARAQGKDWEAKLAALLPSSDEDRWLTIPWRVSLPEAMEEATRSGRPIMAWVMNGNPLGCG